MVTRWQSEAASHWTATLTYCSDRSFLIPTTSDNAQELKKTLELECPPAALGGRLLHFPKLLSLWTSRQLHPSPGLSALLFR